MSTNSINPTTTTTPTPPAAAAARSTMLGQDAFMNLLITQLQNQDPTQPQDNAEFIAQLATFSSLEQLQSMNQTLTKIATFFNDIESVTSKTGSTGSSATTGTTDAITGK